MRLLLLSSLLLLPLLLLLLGCPVDDDDDDDSSGVDDDDDDGEVDGAFEVMAGLVTLECNGVSDADPSGTFTVGGLYGISVYAEDHTIQFVSNGGVFRTRAWDGVDDVITGSVDEGGQILITIVEEDAGLGEVRWDPSFDGVVTARYAPPGGAPIYSFIAQK